MPLPFRPGRGQNKEKKKKKDDAFIIHWLALQRKSPISDVALSKREMLGEMVQAGEAAIVFYSSAIFSSQTHCKLLPRPPGGKLQSPLKKSKIKR